MGTRLWTPYLRTLLFNASHLPFNSCPYLYLFFCDRTQDFLAMAFVAVI